MVLWAQLLYFQIQLNEHRPGVFSRHNILPKRVIALRPAVIWRSRLKAPLCKVVESVLELYGGDQFREVGKAVAQTFFSL